MAAGAAAFEPTHRDAGTHLEIKRVDQAADVDRRLTSGAGARKGARLTRLMTPYPERPRPAVGARRRSCWWCERNPDACARHAAGLRSLPAADVLGPRLGARDLLGRDRAPEPGVGPRAAVHRHGRRPVRRGARDRGGRDPVHRGPRDDGVLDHRARARRFGGAAHRAGAERRELRRRARRRRARRPAGAAHGRARAGRRGRLDRPVRDAAVRAGADLAVRLVQRAPRCSRRPRS